MLVSLFGVPIWMAAIKVSTKKTANEILFPPQRLKRVFRTERFRLKSECRDGAFGLRACTHFAQRKSNNAPPVPG